MALIEGQVEADTRDDEFGMIPPAWANEKGPGGQAFAAADRSVLTREEQWGYIAHAACIWGRIDILKWLIFEGVDVQLRSRQAKDGRRHTTIILEERKAAIDRDCTRIVELLRGTTHVA